jgi:hypothetical protein
MFAAQALLAARGVPVSALAITGAALEFLQMYELPYRIIETLGEALKKK